MGNTNFYYYDLYGFKARSNIEFPQLLPSSEIPDVINIDIVMEDSDISSEKEKDLYEDGKSFGNSENGIWFVNQAGRFTVETIDDITTLHCVKYCDIHESIIRSFFMGNCIAIALTQKNLVPLHGSSLIYKGKTILVCGGSGAGKSTLTTALINKGATLMADDISAIDIEGGTCYTCSGFPEQKLCRDAAINNGFDLDTLRYVNEDSDKFSLDRNDIFFYGRKKVDALYIVRKSSAENAEGFENGVRVREINGADKVNAVTDMLFLKQLYGLLWGFSPAEMMRCVALAGQIKVVELTRKNGMDTIDCLVNAIEESWNQ